MPQSDILNPHPRHPLNPDYSFQRKRPMTHLNQKANRGVPYFRDVTDVMHQFVLSWNDRPVEAMDQLKWYYEQYQDGFFTYVDHEDEGRQYVGHFTSPVEPSPSAHGHWFAQQVTFDEVPNVPMLVYPHRWDKDAVWMRLVNDYGYVMTATSGSTWTLTSNALALSKYNWVGANANTADFAAYQYKGYGFQFWAYTGANMGKAALLLDGVNIATIDFYNGSSSGAPTMLFQQLNVPLGIHVVELLSTHTKNASSSGYTIAWDALKVMR